MGSPKQRDRDYSPPTPYYQDAWTTIYHGDCREILDRLTFDCIVTDPPYGVGKKYGQYNDNSELSDTISIPFRMFGRRALVTCGIGNIWKYPIADWVLCWWKPNAMTRAKVANANVWEPILVYGCKGFGRDGVEVTITPQPIDHPCPKPEKLFRWLISQATEEREIVCDPFMGSGTTLVAAKELNRFAIGIEIEERYCEIAATRLQQEVMNFTTAVADPAGLQGLLVPDERANINSAQAEASQMGNAGDMARLPAQQDSEGKA